MAVMAGPLTSGPVNTAQIELPTRSSLPMECDFMNFFYIGQYLLFVKALREDLHDKFAAVQRGIQSRSVLDLL